jgi:hypothetical protein
MDTFHIFEEILYKQGVIGATLAVSPVLHSLQAKLVPTAKYILLQGEKLDRDFEHVGCKDPQWVIVLCPQVEHHHGALPWFRTVLSIFAWDLRGASSRDEVGHEKIRLRLEAIFEGSENGYEENGRTWDSGVVEGDDGAEAYLHSRTDAKERAETKLIRDNWVAYEDVRRREISAWLLCGRKKGLHRLVHCKGL